MVTHCREHYGKKVFSGDFGGGSLKGNGTESREI
jgi:hypothetical protein